MQCTAHGPAQVCPDQALCSSDRCVPTSGYVCARALCASTDRGRIRAEIHPYNVQARAVAYAQAQGLAVTAYSSFGPLGFRVFGSAKSLGAQPLFTHPTVAAIAGAHAGAGATPAQVVLRWAVQRGLAVIPKADAEAMMRENLACADAGLQLSPAEMEAISALDRGLRFNDPADVSAFIGSVRYLSLDDSNIPTRTGLRGMSHLFVNHPEAIGGWSYRSRHSASMPNYGGKDSRWCYMQVV